VSIVTTTSVSVSNLSGLAQIMDPRSTPNASGWRFAAMTAGHAENLKQLGT
jgi:hypothetical protein